MGFRTVGKEVSNRFLGDFHVKTFKFSRYGLNNNYQ